MTEKTTTITKKKEKKRRTKILHYCEECGKWCGSNEECPDCKVKTIVKEVPLRRNSMYYIKGIDEPLISVTTILKVLAKPQLIYWAAKTAAANALADPYMSEGEAAASIYGKRDSAGNVGSSVHDMIDKGVYGDVDELPTMVREYMRAYEKWEKQFVKGTIFKEQTVYSEKFRYAGTLDRIIESFDGKKWLVDFKTSKGLYADTGLQLSAYRQAVLEMGLLDKIDGIAGVHLKPDGTFSFVEYNDDFDVFMALKKVHEWNDK